MLMLIMQFFWKYIDDFMGKGLGTGIVLEVLFYISASLIPLALPLAMLLSSIMTLGNLAEHNELTALKASGLSLFRILRPLAMTVLLISCATFYFANYVIPVANLKWHALIYDIQQTKVAALVTPGRYSVGIEGYAIKVERGKDNTFEGITIHDYTTPPVIKTVKADSGKIYRSADGRYILFQLINGHVAEEMDGTPPVFTPDKKVFARGGSLKPTRKTSFSQAVYKMELKGFNLDRSQDETFRNDFEMLNVFQINRARDSMQKQANQMWENNGRTMENRHAYFISEGYRKNPNAGPGALKDSEIPDTTISWQKLSPNDRLAALNRAVSKAYEDSKALEGQKTFMSSIDQNSKMFSLEFHKKIALTTIIIVLFFVGAPLGAIVKKGGFGAPVVIAALLFMIYFVMTSIGESLARNLTVSPFIGIWAPTFLLIPVAGLLMVAAANDMKVFDKKLWRYLFSFGLRR